MSTSLMVDLGSFVGWGKSTAIGRGDTVRLVVPLERRICVKVQFNNGASSLCPGGRKEGM